MSPTTASITEKIRQQLSILSLTGLELYYSFDDAAREEASKLFKGELKKRQFASEYQQWYSEALEVVRALLPNRLSDFKELYAPAKRRELSLETFGIADYVLGYELTHRPGANKSVAAGKFYQQFQILQACQRKLDSALMNIRELLHADLLRGEIEEARELAKRKFSRAAGAVAGVALERHLRLTAEAHNIIIKKRDPGVNDLNELLKQADLYDTPTWRFITRLADIRNLADHDKKREPTPEEIDELIAGVEKVMATVA